MKITHEMQGGTVGSLAAFLAHALSTGVALDSPIDMHRGRASDIVDITIEIVLPGFETPQGAAGELKGVAGGTRVPRATRPRGKPSSDMNAPAETPPSE